MCSRGPDKRGLIRLSDYKGRIGVHRDFRVHPLSHLKKAGEWIEHNGRLRKYYSITELGRQRIDEFLEEWKELLKVYNFITKMKDGGENDQN
jgi:hypothetical protein